MRKILLTVFALLLLVSSAAAAQGPVGVVDMPRIIKESEPGQQARATLQETFKSTQEDLDRQKNELEKMRADLQNQSLVLSQSAKEDKEQEFKRRIRDLQDSVQSFQRKYKAEEDKLSEPIITVIFEALRDYGKKNGYAMIVDGNNAGVLYVEEKTNITDAIIVEVNKAWKAKNKK
ncbi:OmpH family outer membrane protein [Desulfocurvus sp.]|jgi:outer membrane protein|uniref:OmpH family outer membrane protein n=1 Tax=Desulfocurvus sp. TaxID=2871698 RepID=UPI0025C1F799|nr:OmpH family outer membrane protein [Desulfocurvus sp.]MCK9240968.1 OmpH family outer membrane protein [Desulfocurvus sp.]